MERFSNQNDFAAAHREGSIAGVAQDDDDDDYNTDLIHKTEPEPKPVVDPNPEDPDDPPVISFDPSESRSKIIGVPPS